MDQISKKQLELAFKIWLNDYGHEEIDQKVEPFLSEKIKVTQGWLRKTRQAMFLSTGQMAEKLKISRSAYSKFERNEEQGAITISTLSEIAKAMNCELVYAIRPKTKTKYSEIIWQKLMPESMVHGWVKTRPENFKGRSLAAIAKLKMNDSGFRQKNNWSER